MMRKHKFYQGRALDRELRTIYEERGRLPDMTRLEHEYHRRTTRLLLGLVIFLALLTGASWLGFFLFGTLGGEGKVTLEIEGPQAVVSGVSQQITIRYRNADREPLAFSTLRLRIPPTVLVQNTDPAPLEKGRLEWKFGTLPAGEVQEVQLTLIPYGLVNHTLDLQAVVLYKPGDFNAEFQTASTHTFTVRAAPVAITLTGPAEARAGQELSFTVTMRNETDETLSEVQALLNSPSTFRLSEPSATPESSGNISTPLALLPSEEKELSFKGSFLSSAQGPQPLTIRLARVLTAQESYPLAEANHTVVVPETQLQVELLLNDAAEDHWARLGETVRLTVRLTNRSEEPMKEVRVHLPLTGLPLDWTRTTAENGTLQEQALAFPAQGTLTLAPQQPVELKATLTTARGSAPTIPPVLDLFAQVLMAESTLQTPPRKLTIVSDLTLTTETRYFGPDEKPVGAGPLPPQVGQETRFLIRLRLKNTHHDLSDLAVLAKLPPGLRFAGATQTTAGKLNFQENTREIRWEIPRLPVTTPGASAQFEVGVTPAEEDRGKLLLLLGVARAEALDTITQTTFSTDAPSVSSALDLDPLGKGKGVVQ